MAKRLQRGVNPEEAIMSLNRMPAENWPSAQMNGLTQDLLSYLKEMPADRSVGQAGIEALSLGQAAADRLPEELGQTLRAELRQYGAPVHIIRTIPARMKYDREHIQVTAGESIRLVLKITIRCPTTWFS